MESTVTPLAAMMERNRLQQKQVATGVGVSRITVGDWQHGRSVPTGKNLQRLLVFLRQFEPELQIEDILGAPDDAEELVVGAQPVVAR